MTLTDVADAGDKEQDDKPQPKDTGQGEVADIIGEVLDDSVTGDVDAVDVIKDTETSDYETTADVCVPACESKDCGDDGCGSKCGICPENSICTENGLCVCIPACQDMACGDDGCGSTCGACGPEEYCHDGSCHIPWMLPDTGQKTCYDNESQIACPAPGQPFYDQDGSHTGAEMDFVDNGDGTVADQVTGLTWAKCSAGLSGTDCGTGELFAGEQGEAVQHCLDDKDGLPGEGWRLPTRLELFSIVHMDKHPCVTDDFVAESGYYWSSTATCSVSFHTCSSGCSAPGGDVYARCVRGDPLERGAYQQLGAGVVKDMAVGLGWQQADDGIPRAWKQALMYCDGLELGGFEDWRLPNAKENLTLVDMTPPVNALDEVYFAGPGDQHFWSSTTFSLQGHHDAALALKPNGALGHFTDTKTLEKLVRCVRSSSGVFGAVEFDGTLSHLPDDGFTGERTYSLWFKANTLTGKQGLLIKKETPGAGSVRPITIMLVDDKLVAGATSTEGIEIGSWTVSAGTWHHVAVHVSPDYGELFINGMKIAEKEMPGTVIDNVQDYVVGAIPSSSNYTYFFEGQVFNVRAEPGFLYDSDFEPCEVVGVDEYSALVTGNGETPCN